MSSDRERLRAQAAKRQQEVSKERVRSHDLQARLAALDMVIDAAEVNGG